MNKSGKLMMNMSLAVADTNGDTFTARFASQWFMKIFMYSGALPV